MANHMFDAIRAAARPEAIFIETTDGRRWTYADMLAASARFAGVLAALGVEPGDRVAVQVEKSPQAVLLYLACLRAGAIYLPLNTAYTLAELDYFVSDAEPRLVVVSPAARAGVEAIAAPRGARVETLDEAVARAREKLGTPPPGLRLEDYDEGLSVQVMHVGPYSAEGPTLARLHGEFLPANGLKETGRHHEIYIGDPRRTAPEKLKTVLRQPVRRL